jgi:very-short-patch-repair endonuclease
MVRFSRRLLARTGMRARIRNEFSGLNPAPIDTTVDTWETYGGENETTTIASSAGASSSSRAAQASTKFKAEEKEIVKPNLNAEQLTVLLDHVSKGGMEDRAVWNTYAEMVKVPLASMSPTQVCSVVRSFTRVNFVKHSLLNQAVRQISKSPDLTPRQIAQLLSDLAKLDFLDESIALAFAEQVKTHAHAFRPFDLPLVLHAFAKIDFRYEPVLNAVCDALLKVNPADWQPTAVASTTFSLARLNFRHKLADELWSTHVARKVHDMSVREVINCAFAMLLADCDPPCPERSQFVSKRSKSSRPEKCQTSNELDTTADDTENSMRRGERPEGLNSDLLLTLVRTAARKAKACGVKGSQGKSLTALPPSTAHQVAILCAALSHSTCMSEQLRPCTKSLSAEVLEFLRWSRDAEKVIKHSIYSSKLQTRLEKVLKAFESGKWESEYEARPYRLDWAAPKQKLAIEVDGFKHFYAMTRDPTAKTQLKARILEAMGWSVVALPYYELQRQPKEEVKRCLAAKFEAVAGTNWRKRFVPDVPRAF